MKERLLKSDTEIRKSTLNHTHYGVFALKNFNRNEIIEECPFIVLKQVSDDIQDHVFYEKNSDLSALLLGNGSLYNHAELPNASWSYNETTKLFLFKALRNIHKGEEIFIYYSPHTFDSSGTTLKSTSKVTKNFLTLLSRTGFIILISAIVMIALLPHKSSSKMNQKNLSGIQTLAKKTVQTL